MGAEVIGRYCRGVQITIRGLCDILGWWVGYILSGFRNGGCREEGIYGCGG